MRARVLATLVATCLAAVLVAGCDPASEHATGGHSVKELRSTPAESNGSSDPGSDFDPTDGPDVSIPGSDDLPDVSIPDVGAFGDSDCVKAIEAWVAVISLRAGVGDPDELQQDVDGLEAELPDEFQHDIETLATAYQTMLQQGPIDGAAALDTPEVREASQRIDDYLSDVCGLGD